MRYVIPFFSLLLALTAFLPLLSVDWWWVRIWDFPRLQLLILYVVAIMFMLSGDWRNPLAVLLLSALVAGSLLQVYWIFPYMPFAPTQTKVSTITDRDNSIRIVAANVLMTNRSTDDFLQIVKSADPDLLIVTEPDKQWELQLQALDPDFPYSTKVPQANTYGMIVYSKLPLIRSTIKYLVEDDVPSIHSLVKLRSGATVEVIAVHPRPPQPGVDSDKRDAELVLVGRLVKASEYPAIVAGDMNDVGWSKNSIMFQKVSGMLDPRRGRGLFPTYNAIWPLLRYPLDHLFHTDEFRLRHIEVLSDFNSDHFPLLVELTFEPERNMEQEAPELDQETRKEADEQLNRARD